jgi:hypothetical protein
LVLADGIVTDAERRDLVIVAELLGVPLEDLGAKKADELGVRKMAEPVFWRALGVEID